MKINRKGGACQNKIGQIYQVLVPESIRHVDLGRTDWKSAFYQHKKVVSEAIKCCVQEKGKELSNNKKVRFYSQPDTQLLGVENSLSVNNKKQQHSID